MGHGRPHAGLCQVVKLPCHIQRRSLCLWGAAASKSLGFPHAPGAGLAHGVLHALRRAHLVWRALERIGAHEGTSMQEAKCQGQTNRLFWPAETLFARQLYACSFTCPATERQLYSAIQYNAAQRSAAPLERCRGGGAPRSACRILHQQQSPGGSRRSSGSAPCACQRTGTRTAQKIHIHKALVGLAPLHAAPWESPACHPSTGMPAGSTRGSDS